MAIQIVIIILGLLTIGGGLYETNHIWLEQSQNQSIVQKTADTWSRFADGLNDYVQQNESNINSSATVSCQTLQSDDYYGGSCTDPVGQNLEGVISAPYGFPQSWGVIATSQPSSSLLSQYGMGNTLIEQSLKWHSFLYNVATVLQGDNLHAYVYNGGSQTFKQPFGDSNVNSSYANYNLPVNPTTYGQSVDGVGPNGLMAFPQLQKEPGYWLWQAQLMDSDNSASISFVNYGYSSVCPPGGGITPVTWDTSESPWVQNNGSGLATYLYWGYRSGTTFSTNGFYLSPFDPIMSSAYYQQFFVCVPAPETIVNDNQAYDPFNSVNGSITNAVNPSIPTSPDGNRYWSSSEYWNGDGENDAQAGNLYTIHVGNQIYSLVAYAGETGAVYPGSGYVSRVLALAFYVDNTQVNPISPSVSEADQIAPSIFGGQMFDNTGGFYASPVVTLSSQSVTLG